MSFLFDFVLVVNILVVSKGGYGKVHSVVKQSFERVFIFPKSLAFFLLILMEMQLKI